MIPRGLQYMLLSAFAFSAMAAFVKAGGATIPEQEMIAFRSLFIIAATLPIMLSRGIPVFGVNKKGLLMRGAFGFTAMSCYFWTLNRMSIADAIVIQYTNPIFTILFASIFLKEKSVSRLWVAVALCLLGVVAIAKSGFGGNPLFALVGVGAAVFSGAAYTVVRSLRHTENAYTIVFYFPLVSLPFSLVAAAPNWVWPTGWAWAAVGGVALFSYLGQIFLTKGLELESAGRAVTMNYMTVGFGVLIGWVAFNQAPDLLSFCGILLILTGITLINKKRFRRKTASITNP